MGYGYDNSLEELESELGQQMTWNGAQYPCMIGARNETKELGEGGYALQASLEIVCRLAIFPNSTPPGLKETVSIGTRLLRISDVLHDPSGEFVVLSGYDPTTGV